MNKIMNKFLKFHCLPFHRKLMYPEALILSAYYRFQILHMPFKNLSPQIGTINYETSHEHCSDVILKEVAQVIDGVCSHTPWESKCLVRAMAAKKMLNRRGYLCTLYMGVRLEKYGKMQAHAWLRCGDLYITGGNGNHYTITTIFGDCND